MKPNILLITADQWRGDCVSAAGHAVIRTPHLDALAAEGTLFRRHYAGAAPCSPARASIYTGLYQMNHRVCVNGTPLDRRLDTIALAARRAGYDPTLFGYTDVSPDPRSLHPKDPHLTSYEGVLPGFTVGQLLTEDEKQWLSWLRDRGHKGASDRSVHLTSSGVIDNTPPAYTADETQTAFLTDGFLRWLGEQDKPWFAHLSFLRPHPPFCVPEPYNELYPPGLGPTFARAKDRQQEAEIHPFIRYALDRPMLSSFIHGREGRVADLTDDDFRVIRSIYYGMIGEVDAQFGRICGALKATGAWNDTVIVFTSDHGEMMGDHWSLGKGGFHEASYHIPLIIRDPAAEKRAGERVDAFTSAADLMPTLCERMGVDPINHQDGRSLQPFIHGQKDVAWRDHAFWEFDFRDIAGQTQETYFGLPSGQCNLSVIRDENFKYVHFAGLEPLLFDMRNDPWELRNLANDPAFLRVRLEYAERLLCIRAMHLDQTLAYTALTETGALSRSASFPQRTSGFSIDA